MHVYNISIQVDLRGGTFAFYHTNQDLCIYSVPHNEVGCQGRAGEGEL